MKGSAPIQDYLRTDTILALSTPTGGALSLVRGSGPKIFDILSALTGGKQFSPRRATRVELRDPRTEKKIDEAVVTTYLGPRSFTGEDVCEIALHGSPRIAERLIQSAIALGARLALPGEFSFRAVRAGKISLPQAEAIKELVAAESDGALDLALEKWSGTQAREVAETREQLMRLAVLSELGIDFSDQDVDEVSLPRLKKDLAPLIEKINRLADSFERGKKLNQGVPLAIVGRPNVGKSSLFNALLGEDRSIVTDIAGTTRDVVRERLTLRAPGGAVLLRLADTAGIRATQDVVEGLGVERSWQAVSQSDVIVFVVNARDGITAEDRAIFKTLKSRAGATVPVIGVVNQCDQMSNAEASQILSGFLAEFGGMGLVTPIMTSATTGVGVSELAQTVAQHAWVRVARQTGEVLLTQEHHVQACRQALERLNGARDVQDVVLFATDVRHAMADLGPLMGEVVTDDILGRIFSDFCIGK